MLFSLSGPTRSAPGIDRGDFLKRGMETGGGKAKRKSIPGKLLQDPNTVSFISEGLAVKYNSTWHVLHPGRFGLRACDSKMRQLQLEKVPLVACTWPQTAFALQ